MPSSSTVAPSAAAPGGAQKVPAALLRREGYTAAADAVGGARALYKIGLHRGDNRAKARTALVKARELVAKGPTEVRGPDASAPPNPKPPWKARTPGNKMLDAWGRSSTVYAEVPVAGDDDRWGRGATRWIDGVRRDGGGVLSFRRNRAAARLELEGHPSDLVEVKQALNTGAIGQVVAVRFLFEARYGRRPERSIILCAESDEVLERVCSGLGIEMVNGYLKAPKKASSKGSSDHAAMLAGYQEKHGGRVFTGFAVGPEPAVGAVRRPDVEAGGVVAGTRETLGALQGDQIVKLIHVAPKVSRGSIGRIVSWAAVFKHATGRTEVEQILLHREPLDGALGWCCTKLGIAVEQIPG